MTYAVVDIGGSQIILEPGRFYDVNYISSNPGDAIRFNRVLLFSQEGNFSIGKPCLQDVAIKAVVLKHLIGNKVNVFKVKPKKNNRISKGHRQRLTRIFVEDISY
uniref:Large ribosomal subunit protein bL21c n=1 Tax=Polysiphonia sertularioides TaxID=945028 RepID=A0A1Z1M8V6_9FLOR|nr:ribosomal protein L21 [Polysiphonia sertularioides]ARW62410.1 ribosomal protein L21 [Polysiphonia sertularioides]